MKILNSNNEHRQTALAPKSYFLEKKVTHRPHGSIHKSHTSSTQVCIVIILWIRKVTYSRIKF